MAHYEIAAALTTFFGLVVAWFAVPSRAPAREALSSTTDVGSTDAIPSAA